MCLHVVERGSGFAEAFGGDPGPSREVVDDGLARLDELVVYDDSGRVVDETYACELLAVLCQTLFPESVGLQGMCG